MPNIVKSKTGFIATTGEGQQPHKELQLHSGVAWKCTTCRTVLGFTDEKKETLRIKYKDFYCYIRGGNGGEVTVLCRRCSTMNTIKSDPELKPQQK